jgi:FAD/FMN-containing dehydrogenase
LNPSQSYAERRARLIERFAAGGSRVRLAKDTSNLFRDREAHRGGRLDVKDFSGVLGINAQEAWVEAEGMTPYDLLVDLTLRHGLMPAVVPELKSITIGGAAAGVGIEATSFRQGLVHETLLETEVLVGDGRVLICRPDNEHRDLFFGFPNSYGTLGYALRLRARTLPVKPFVRVEHRRHGDPEAFFADLESTCAGDADFVDGVVFEPGECYTNEARFVDEAPGVSDYSFEQIYYRSIRERPLDYLRTRDYIWRWDTDWFWCSKSIGAQNPVLRRLLGRGRLNSRFYTRVMRLNSRWGLSRRWERLLGIHSESVIQDVDVPVSRASEFLRFFDDEIGIRPVWICPTRSPDAEARFDLYPMDSGTLYVNFGFWDVVRTRSAHETGHFNRLVERKVEELGGIKSLYSSSYFPRERFWEIYGGETYRRLKTRYDPDRRFPDLYEKCVLRR